jgi:hypothetical protein
MRTCTHCKIEKTDDQFHNKKNGKLYICKECRKIYIRKHYKRNKKKYLENLSNRKNELKEWFNEIRSKMSCKICGEDRWWVLDFHHRENKKESVPLLVHKGASKHTIVEEMSKCDVLCSNCHRDLHYRERKAVHA